MTNLWTDTDQECVQGWQHILWCSIQDKNMGFIWSIIPLSFNYVPFLQACCLNPQLMGNLWVITTFLMLGQAGSTMGKRGIGFALPWVGTVVGTFDPNHSPPSPSSPHCPTWRVVVLIGTRGKQADGQEHVLVRPGTVSWGTMCEMRIQASGICLISHRPSFKNHKFRENMKYFEIENTEQ